MCGFCDSRNRSAIPTNNIIIAITIAIPITIAITITITTQKRLVANAPTLQANTLVQSNGHDDSDSKVNSGKVPPIWQWCGDTYNILILCDGDGGCDGDCDGNSGNGIL
ncbi:hypothetical protein EDC01DRAFT_731293 [Geopyxis carbonaria]|nr:hypothetical protein EDC01DRAFT_731293 [Geopyxis carbonaria]